MNLDKATEEHLRMIQSRIKSPIYLAALEDRINTIQSMGAEEMLHAMEAAQHEIDGAQQGSEAMWLATATSIAIRAQKGLRDAQANTMVAHAVADMPPPPTPKQELDGHIDQMRLEISMLQKEEQTPEVIKDLEMLTKVVENHEKASAEEQAEIDRIKDYDDHRAKLEKEREAKYAR